MMMADSMIKTCVESVCLCARHFPHFFSSTFLRTSQNHDHDCFLDEEIEAQRISLCEITQLASYGIYLLLPFPGGCRMEERV